MEAPLRKKENFDHSCREKRAAAWSSEEVESWNSDDERHTSSSNHGRQRRASSSDAEAERHTISSNDKDGDATWSDDDNSEEGYTTWSDDDDKEGYALWSNSKDGRANLSDNDKIADDETTKLVEDRDDAWPHDVVRIVTTENPDQVIFEDDGPTDRCNCVQRCYRDWCPNAVTALYCTSRNCRLGPECENRPRDASGLKLSKSNTGIGVIATQFISEGDIVGEYSGVLTTRNYEKNTQRTSDYALALESRSASRKHVYVQARDRGGITQFINHACDADCLFFEVRYRCNRKIVVVAVRNIQAGSEVTVDYSDIWFSYLWICKLPQGPVNRVIMNIEAAKCWRSERKV